MSEKSEILDELESLKTQERRVTFNYFLFLLLLLIFVGILIFPKIYITQQIYFKSRDISKLKHEYDTLKEENKIISASVEEIKFKNQILDTLF